MLAFVLFGCSNKSEISQPSEAEAQKVAQIGGELTKTLLDTLGATLKSSMQTDGPVAAIDVCKIEAGAIAERVAGLSDETVSIKRTTFKYRNLKNAPDKFEKEALNHFTKIAEDGKQLPPFYIQKITTNDQVEFNYYKPLKVQSLCLTCHGDLETMDSILKETIAANYPSDMATGYKLDDFRGLVRVKITN